MDPIEEQIQQQIAELQARENFQNYQPSMGTGISSVANEMNLAPQDGQMGMGDMAKTAIGNVIKNKALEAAARKVGIEQLGFASQVPVFGGLLQSVAPPVLGFTGLAAVKNKIANRGMQSVINRESTRDLQRRMDAGEFGSTTPTPQDAGRGGGQRTAPASTTYSDAQQSFARDR